MICKFKDVIERDIDLLFIEEFSCSKIFLKIFLDKIAIENADIIEILHSKTDIEYGESDITIITKSGERKIALLIEDKIDAKAMPEQYNRYVIRGELGIKNNDYSEFYIFMVAPKKYLSENAEAQKYPYHVTYEECIEYFEKLNDNRAIFKLQQLRNAIEKHKKSSQTIKSERATNFWNEYVKYQKANYSQICISNENGVKSARMKWVHYFIGVSKINLIHKIDKGFVDLEFSGCGNKIIELKSYIISVIGDLSNNGVVVFKTGKAAVLRVHVPKINFDTDFKKDEEKFQKCLQAISRLHDIAYKLIQHGIEII